MKQNDLLMHLLQSDHDYTLQRDKTGEFKVKTEHSLHFLSSFKSIPVGKISFHTVSNSANQCLLDLNKLKSMTP